MERALLILETFPLNVSEVSLQHVNVSSMSQAAKFCTGFKLLHGEKKHRINFIYRCCQANYPNVFIFVNSELQIFFGKMTLETLIRYGTAMFLWKVFGRFVRNSSSPVNVLSKSIYIYIGCWFLLWLRHAVINTVPTPHLLLLSSLSLSVVSTAWGH
jgi:hypothetical protein